jgi:hypothetical protein
VADPFWSDVVLLVRGQGADAGTTFDDESDDNRTISAFGNAQVDTAVDLHGPSIQLDGTGDYLTVPDHADLAAATAGSMTIEAEVYVDELGKLQTIMGKRSGTNEHVLYLGATNQFNFQTLRASATDVNISHTGVTVTLGGTYHVAVVRVGTTWTIYVNGSAGGSQTEAGAPAATATPYYIGRQGVTTTRDAHVHISWVRITRAARYTGAFTPVLPYEIGAAAGIFDGAYFDTAVFDAFVPITGSLGATLAPLTSAGAAQLAIRGSTTATLAPLLGTAAGKLGISGALGATLAPVTSSGFGFGPRFGAGTITLAPLTGAGTARLAIHAQASATLAPLTSAGSARLLITGSAGYTFAPLLGLGAGALAIKGAGTATLAPLTMTAFGARPLDTPFGRYLFLRGSSAGRSQSITQQGSRLLEITGQGLAGRTMALTQE